MYENKQAFIQKNLNMNQNSIIIKHKEKSYIYVLLHNTVREIFFKLIPATHLIICISMTLLSQQNIRLLFI